MAAARVVEGASRSSNEGVKSVDVYKTHAKLIIFSSSVTTDPEDAFTSLRRRQNPIEQALFVEKLYNGNIDCALYIAAYTNNNLFLYIFACLYIQIYINIYICCSFICVCFFLSQHFMCIHSYRFYTHVYIYYKTAN